MLDLASPAQAGDLALAEWSAAEVLDTPLAHDQTLRAIVLRLGAHKWQWSVSSIDGDESGELISAGIEKTAAAARETATSEIAKCVESPLA
ncbi:MAG TPA: hypothetical protein VNV38_17660 [Stellaceae bacterium]|jgi:hypothetical protein|nr:hypothetical protein [Stellaceae bacterium]